MLTDVKGSLGEFKVAPDGKWIAYAGYEPPADLEKARKEKRDFHVVDADPENMAIYLIPAEANAEGKRDAKKVFEAKYHVANFDWSPDGKNIAFEHWPSPLADDWTKADIAEAEIATGKVTELAKTPCSGKRTSLFTGRPLSCIRQDIRTGALARRCAHRAHEQGHERSPAAARYIRCSSERAGMDRRFEELGVRRSERYA